MLWSSDPAEIYRDRYGQDLLAQRRRPVGRRVPGLLRLRGCLNAVLKPARRDAQTLLYYPIHDLWAEYLPVAGPLREAPQSPRAAHRALSWSMASGCNEASSR